jgi:hypothetical protein
MLKEAFLNNQSIIIKQAYFIHFRLDQFLRGSVTAPAFSLCHCSD